MAGFVCTAALKEWAVAIEALGTGRQALIVRKGGIREEGNRFEVRYPEFLLFPSFEHQQSELLRPEHAAALTHAMERTPASDGLTFMHFVRVHQAYAVSEIDQLRALAPHHIWSDAYAEKRLRWRPKQALTAMVLRVYTLPAPITVPMRPEYAGCKSWLELAEPVVVDGLAPAMPDDAFAREAAAIDDALAEASLAGASA